MTIGLNIGRLGLGSLRSANRIIPPNVLTINGNPLTINGEYLTYTAKTQTGGLAK